MTVFIGAGFFVLAGVALSVVRGGFDAVGESVFPVVVTEFSVAATGNSVTAADPSRARLH